MQKNNKMSPKELLTGQKEKTFTSEKKTNGTQFLCPEMKKTRNSL